MVFSLSTLGCAMASCLTLVEEHDLVAVLLRSCDSLLLDVCSGTRPCVQLACFCMNGSTRGCSVPSTVTISHSLRAVLLPGTSAPRSVCCGRMGFFLGGCVAPHWGTWVLSGLRLTPLFSGRLETVAAALFMFGASTFLELAALPA